jgi:hypothetical protein
MANFSMTCTCGDTVTVDAPNREAAVSQFKGMMDEAGIAHHFAEKHPGQPVPPASDVHAMLEQAVAAA